jgi:hypothetical protein
VGLNRMLAHHGQEAREWILEMLGQGNAAVRGAGVSVSTGGGGEEA